MQCSKIHQVYLSTCIALWHLWLIRKEKNPNAPVKSLLGHWVNELLLLTLAEKWCFQQLQIFVLSKELSQLIDKSNFQQQILPFCLPIHNS